MADIEDANIPVSPFPEPLDGDQDFQSHDEPLKLEIRRPVRLADRWSWSPLTNDHDIRVMIIEPARNIRDVITCTFRTISIKDDPKQEYSALSYAWGDSFEDNRHLTEYIHCGSNVLRITRTLRQALQRIRNMAKLGILAATLPIWIDAICINQRNTPERNHQVAIMGSIYRCCTSLFVWLGEEVNAADGQENLSSILDPHREPWHSWPSQPLTEEQQKLAVKSLLRRPWFHRRWTVQEYLQSDEHLFVIGPLMLTGKQFFDIIKTHCGKLGLSGVLVITRPVASISCKRVVTDESWRVATKQFTLLDNLHHFSEALCRHPHDRVYALLSISTDAPLITVDYAHHVKRLYTHVALQYIEPSTFSLLLVNAVHRRSHDNHEAYATRWPSWVPDWTQAIDSTALAKTLQEEVYQWRLLWHGEIIHTAFSSTTDSLDKTIMSQKYEGFLSILGVLVQPCIRHKSLSTIVLPHEQDAMACCIDCHFPRVATRSIESPWGDKTWYAPVTDQLIMLVRDQPCAWKLMPIASGFYGIVDCFSVRKLFDWKVLRRPSNSYATPNDYYKDIRSWCKDWAFGRFEQIVCIV